MSYLSRLAVLVICLFGVHMAGSRRLEAGPPTQVGVNGYVCAIYVYQNGWTAVNLNSLPDCTGASKSIALCSASSASTNCNRAPDFYADATYNMLVATIHDHPRRSLGANCWNDTYQCSAFTFVE